MTALTLVASACGGSDTEVAAIDAAGNTDTAEPVEQAESASPVPAQSDFPQFTAATIGGAQLDFGSLEGQDALLWFWAPW